MKKVLLYSGVFLAGVIVALIAIIYIYKDNIDLLSISRGYPVKINRNVTITDSKGTKIILPVGATLMFKSQYREVGTFILEFSATDLKIFERNDKRDMFFQED